jgi:hypothetical protein
VAIKAAGSFVVLFALAPKAMHSRAAYGSIQTRQTA